jgi:hypothetical protein
MDKNQNLNLWYDFTTKSEVYNQITRDIKTFQVEGKDLGAKSAHINQMVNIILDDVSANFDALRRRFNFAEESLSASPCLEIQVCLMI